MWYPSMQDNILYSSISSSITLIHAHVRLIEVCVKVMHMMFAIGVIRKSFNMKILNEFLLTQK